MSKKDIIENWMLEASEYLWTNRRSLCTEDNLFDYPDYGGLPKRCANKLSSGVVDWIQEEAPFIGMSKKSFQRKFIGLCLIEY